MSQTTVLKAAGLYSFPNNLSEVPQGALTTADNVVIDRNGIIESRRGLSAYISTFGTGNDRSAQLLVYKNRLLNHFGRTLQYVDDTGALSTFSGSYSPVTSGLRMKSVEANGNLFFTTDAGMYRISAASASQFSTAADYIRKAGGVQALDINGTIDYTAGGWFIYPTSTPGQTKVAYRMTWAFTDANGNLVEGVPSSRLVLTNYSDSQGGNVNLTFPIPSAITTADTQFFYRIYRTSVVQTSLGVTLSTLDPGDEQYLVIQDFPSGAELTARTITVLDETPESFRQNGSLLYTNPVSGEGILQANYAPPIATDVALFQNTVFYSNTKSIQQLNLAVLSTSAMVSGTSTVSIISGATTNTYTFRGTPEITSLTFDTKANTANGSYFLIDGPSSRRNYFVWFDKTGTDVTPSASDTVGRIAIKANITASTTAADVATVVLTALNTETDFDAVVGGSSNIIIVTSTDNGSAVPALSGATPPGGAFATVVTQAGTGEDTSTKHVLLGNNASTSISIDETARSFVKCINTNASEIVDAFYLSGPTDLPGLILLQARSLSQAAFHVITDDATTTGAEFSPALPASGTSVISSNLVELNAIYYSKFQQPEAVPTVNKFLVGPKDKSIVRILPLRTGLMILKEDGIYRLTGTNGQFNVDPFDNSAIILAPDSAVILNNQIYMLSTQGVVTLTDTGVSVISRPIEDQLTKITTSSYSFQSNTFGVSYEADRAYLLWTVTNPGDTKPTQCFRFNTFTTAWTRWPISKTCGIVKFDEQRLYLGAGDQNFIEQERKDLTRTDYADRDYSLSVPSSSVLTANKVVIISSGQGISKGDVLVQTQYLTVYKFNQLLKMLDTDYGASSHNYYDSFKASTGSDLRILIDDLAAALDTDAGLAETDFSSSLGEGPNFSDFQSDYNIITNLLNLNVNTAHKNYPTSTGTVTFDMVVEGALADTVTVNLLSPIIVGPITLSKSIKCEIIWAPQTFGDPSITKHVSEGTFLFQDTSFTLGTVSYASDLMPAFDEIEFNETGIGDWGKFEWGEQNFGGIGSSVPMRTYIPRDKQYCRFIRPRFVHNTSREKFSLLGASLTFRPITERGYRS